MREPTRVDSHNPTATPMDAVMSSDVVSSSIVLGSRSSTMSETRLDPSVLRRVRASPRSNVRTRPTIPGMRLYHGWSSPYDRSSSERRMTRVRSSSSGSRMVCASVVRRPRISSPTTALRMRSE